MAFGPIMETAAGDVKVRLAPIAKEDLVEFVTDGAMQSKIVRKYLAHSDDARVMEDEVDWYEKTRNDKASLNWGIHVNVGGEWKLIGTTGLHDIQSDHFKITTSGIVIIRPEWWGKGIASAAHKARTWYAFKHMGVHQIRSAVMAPNAASSNALQRVGYEIVFRERNEAFVDGQFIDKVSLNAINPLDPQWSAWWHGDRVPVAYRNARKRTLDALAWADANVTFL